jgi:hypothetical protein
LRENDRPGLGADEAGRQRQLNQSRPITNLPHDPVHSSEGNPHFQSRGRNPEIIIDPEQTSSRNMSWTLLLRLAGSCLLRRLLKVPRLVHLAQNRRPGEHKPPCHKPSNDAVPHGASPECDRNLKDHPKNDSVNGLFHYVVDVRSFPGTQKPRGAEAVAHNRSGREDHQSQ